MSAATILLEKVLVLNADWTPVTTTTVEHAVEDVYSGRASFVDPNSYQVYNFNDWITYSSIIPQEHSRFLHSSTLKISVPEIMIFNRRHSGRVRPKQAKLDLCNLHIRDKAKCAYCSKTITLKQSTMDHVLPSSKGGKTVWTNIVLACFLCNNKKSDSVGIYVPKIKPHTPTNVELEQKSQFIKDKNVPASWKNFITS